MSFNTMEKLVKAAQLSSLQGQNLSMPVLNKFLDFIWCPPGEFKRGTDAEITSAYGWSVPKHKVKLNFGYWIGSTLITTEEWNSFMPEKRQQDTLPLPVCGITWSEALEFCDKLTVYMQNQNIIPPNALINLPTDAQWEYACRAGRNSVWFFGNSRSLLKNYAWYAENSMGKRHPVALKKSNPWGLYDMYGNVMEWCLDDIYGPKSITSELMNDPFHQSNEKYRIKVTRGGGYSNNAYVCSSAGIAPIPDDNPEEESIGLRITLTIKGD